MASPAITTTYSVTVTDVNGCENTEDVTITVNPLPVVEAGLDISVCNQPIQETLTGYSPIVGGVGIWTGPNVTTAGVYTPSGIGTFTLTYTFTDPNTCIETDTIIVEVIAPTIADAGPDLQACVNDSIMLISNFFPATGGVWTGIGVDTSGLFNSLVSGVGVFNLSYCVGEGTCLNCDTMQFTIHEIPDVDFSYNQTCIGDATFFIDLTNPNASSINSW